MCITNCSQIPSKLFKIRQKAGYLDHKGKAIKSKDTVKTVQLHTGSCQDKMGREIQNSTIHTAYDWHLII